MKIQQPVGKITVTEETITPDYAAELLAANEMNRNIRQDWVNYLANEMSGGRWQQNGDTIVIDTEGKIADGQHRLNASIKAGYAFPALIVRGVQPEARLTIDDPLRRKFADDLVMNGQGPNANLKESLLRKILIWNREGGFASGGGARTSRSILASEYPAYAAEMDEAISLVWRHSKNVLGQSIGAFVAWLLLRSADKKVVEKFFSILSIGSQDAADYQVVLLRDRIIALKSDPLLNWRGGGKAPLIIWFAIRGWNAWLTGEKTTFSLPRERRLRNPFPKPAKVA